MISFDQWEADCKKSLREDAKEYFIEKSNYEPTEDEITSLVERISEERHELIYGY